MTVDIQREWAAVNAAPTLFAAATILIGGLIWVALHFLYRHRIDGFKEEIERLRHRLNEIGSHRPGSPPASAPVDRGHSGALADPPRSTSPPTHAGTSDNLDWTDVVDLTPGQVEAFMKGCSTRTVAGLRVIAEHGPVIHASILGRAGIEKYGHFQGRVTQRTRTVTGNPNAFLFAWDDWNSTDNGGMGHYAVTDRTFRSLRIYFRLD